MSAIVEKDVPLNEIACNSCKHYDISNKEGFSCKAFDSIPLEILSGDNDHKKVLKEQDNKIVYEKTS